MKILLRLEEVGLGIIERNDHRTDVTDVNQYALLLLQRFVITTLYKYVRMLQ